MQTRTFSFSDNAIGVELPFGRTRTAIEDNVSPLPASGSWLQSFDAAIHLFRLRQMQSEWYHNLFQSGKTAWADPYRYIWQTYYALGSWWKDVEQSTSSMTKTFFELELNYSYVYILSPSPRVPITSDYAQRLLFEHCIIYGDNFLKAVAQDAYLESLTISFYDMMRAYMTGRQLVDILVRNRDVILSDTLPPASHVPSLPTEIYSELASPPISSSSSPLAPPSIPINYTSTSTSSHQSSNFNTNESTITRTIASINDFTTVLTALGTRFGYLSWRDSFKKEAEPLLSNLRQRLSEQQTTDSVQVEAWQSTGPTTTSATTSNTFWNNEFRARDSVGSILLSDNDGILCANQNIPHQYPLPGIGTYLGAPPGYVPHQGSFGQQYFSYPASHAGTSMPSANQHVWGSLQQGQDQNHQT